MLTVIVSRKIMNYCTERVKWRKDEICITDCMQSQCTSTIDIYAYMEYSDRTTF